MIFDFGTDRRSHAQTLAKSRMLCFRSAAAPATLLLVAVDQSRDPDQSGSLGRPRVGEAVGQYVRVPCQALTVRTKLRSPYRNQTEGLYERCQFGGVVVQGLGLEGRRCSPASRQSGQCARGPDGSSKGRPPALDARLTDGAPKATSEQAGAGGFHAPCCAREVSRNRARQALRSASALFHGEILLRIVKLFEAIWRRNSGSSIIERCYTEKKTGS
jgi:hypothetical protein